MALILVVETGAGLSTANSYATVAEADAYYEARPFSSSWQEMTTLEKTVSLVYATRLLDEQSDWFGTRSTTIQALRWPRSGALDRDGETLEATELPVDIKRATMELAQWVKMADRTAEPDTAGYGAITVGPLSVTIDRSDRKAVLPAIVATMLAPYGLIRRAGGPGSAQLLRV
jgi:hypothetical protein